MSAMKAKIPADASLLLELGSARPEEAAFDAKEPYSIAMVITKGSTRRKFVYINRTKSGISIAHGCHGNFHESYHPDGTRHWKFTGINEETGNEYEEVSDLSIGPPLDQLTGFLPLKAVTAVLADDFLENFSEFADLRQGLIPFHADWPCYFQLFTHCLPWIALSIYEEWPEIKQTK